MLTVESIYFNSLKKLFIPICYFNSLFLHHLMPFIHDMLLDNKFMKIYNTPFYYRNLISYLILYCWIKLHISSIDYLYICKLSVSRSYFIYWTLNNQIDFYFDPFQWFVLDNEQQMGTLRALCLFYLHTLLSSISMNFTFFNQEKKTNEFNPQ